MLHAEFSVPEQYGYTVSDILLGHAVAGSSQEPVPINYAGQVADTFHVCLAGSGLATTAPAQTPLPPVSNKTGEVNGQPVMLLAKEVVQGMLAVDVNSPFVQIPVQMVPNSALQNMALQAVYPNENFKQAEITFWDDNGNPETGISATITDIETSDGTPAGSSSGADGLYNFIINIQVGADVSTGLKGVSLINPQSTQQVIPLPGVINIIGAEG